MAIFLPNGCSISEVGNQAVPAPPRLSRIHYNDHPRNPTAPASINGAVAEQRAALEHYRDGRRDERWAMAAVVAGLGLGALMAWLSSYVLGS